MALAAIIAWLVAGASYSYGNFVRVGSDSLHDLSLLVWMLAAPVAVLLTAAALVVAAL